MALAGVALETSFARFIASMVTFSNERVLFWRSCCWEFVSTVETGGSWEESVWHAGCAEGPEP